MMKRITLAMIMTMLSFSVSFAAVHHAAKEEGVAPDAALMMLKEGNARFVAGKSTHPRNNSTRRTLTADKGQKPFATVLGCSDSRAPIENVFDQGIGDVFVIRVAGNVVGGDQIATVEYGVEHLGTPLVVVMGHTKCGAVTAAVTNAETSGNITALVKKISPAVERAKIVEPYISTKDRVELSIEANIWQSIEELFKDSYIFRELVKEGRVKVVGAKYDIKTGKVEWMGEHKEQEKLLEPSTDLDNTN